jgi:hypothetical protein
MTNYALPTHTGIRNITFRMASQNFITTSPFTFQQQVLNHAGRRWEVDVDLPPMKHSDARIWIAWLAKLDGALNTFNLGDPLGATAQGSAGGTPVVNGSSQTGSSLNIDGCTTNTTNWLKAGDYIQLGTGADARLFMVKDNVNTNSSGQATLSLWPNITTAPANNQSVIVSNPQAAFRLSNNVSTWSVNEASIYGINFSGVAVI